MFGQDNSNIGSTGSVPINNQSGMPEMMQPCPQAAVSPVMENAMTYRAVYPEILYKLMPYISMTCDLIFSYGMMPTQQQLEEMSAGIHRDFCSMYPDMADYMGAPELNGDTSVNPTTFREVFGGDDEYREGFTGGEGFGEDFREVFRPNFGRFRRMGLGRDLIFSLLLSELLGRGGFIY